MSVLSNKKGSRSGIHCKLLPKSVYIYICFSQVVSPLVDLDESNILKMDEWLCDNI